MQKNDLLQSLYDKIESLESQIIEIKENKIASNKSVSKRSTTPRFNQNTNSTQNKKLIPTKIETNIRKSVTPEKYVNKSPQNLQTKTPKKPTSDLKLEELKLFLDENPNEEIPEITIYF